ncbi:hypothetical protein [Kitasatospora mediocidica]|uniref:hypothetical protein n=1 Tax=Kitasatospora mediocidica TaxID=58352 RepID=UPI0005637607|nr:hypothetical protein [Kitasatospora mediocidica]
MTNRTNRPAPFAVSCLISLLLLAGAILFVLWIGDESGLWDIPLAPSCQSHCDNGDSGGTGGTGTDGGGGDGGGSVGGVGGVGGE